MTMFYNYFPFMPFIPPNCQKPPTIYSILESIVNPDVDLNEPSPEIKIQDLAKEGRKTIFNFTYPLSKNISQETFETMILNHYLMRRIGFETVTAFRIQLNVKLNEIMPKINKLFDSLENWDIFNDGEITERTGTDDNTSNSTTNSTNATENTLNNKSTTTNNDISDRRRSDTPQNNLQNIQDGHYVTDYSYDTTNNTATDNSESSGKSNATNNSTNNTTDNKVYKETIKRSPTDKITIYKEMQTNINNIYTILFDELDVLFYSLV